MPWRPVAPVRGSASGCTFRWADLRARSGTFGTEPALQFCPQCGGRGFSQATPKSYCCAACGFVLFLNTAAAVAAVIGCRGAILATVRAAEPARGELDLPGGFVDHAETAEQALQRELREELGLGIEVDRFALLGSYPNVYPFRAVVYHTLDLIYVAELNDYPKLQPADDVSAVHWIPRSAVDPAEFAFGSARAALLDLLSE